MTRRKAHMKDYKVGYGKPPLDSRFLKGQSGCPGGRGGKQPVPQTPSTYDKRVLAAGDRIVTSADGVQTTLIERALAFDAHHAARGDEKSNARFRPEYARASSKEAAVTSRMIEEWLDRWLGVKSAFEEAELHGVLPPDIVPHPDHVQISESDVTIHGPITKKERAVWEYVKHEMRVWSDAIAFTRAKIKMYPEFEALAASLCKMRAMLEVYRRQIPEGWNWKENIYTLGGSRYDIKVFEQGLNLPGG